MRISDWSSDVCSSDLGQLTVATSGYGTQDDVTLQLLAGGGIEMTNVPFEKPAERYASPIGGHTDAIYEEPGDVAQFVKSGQMKRSEEHTSELQSLMRISYAVFCLKKTHKKQKKKNTPRHAEQENHHTNKLIT